MSRWRRAIGVIAFAVALAVPAPAAAVAHQASVQSLSIATVPPIAGLRFQLRDKVYVTDREGRTVIPASDRAQLGAGARDRSFLIKNIRLLPARAPHDGRYLVERWYGAGDTLHAAIDLYERVRFRFQDRRGRPVDLDLIDEVVMKRIDGAIINLKRKQLARPVLLQASRVVPLNGALVSKDLLYRIQRVGIGGNNAVNRAQQAFLPAETRLSTVRLLFYSTRFQARDALFGFPIGSGIRLEYPDGHVEEHDFDGDAELVIPSLPRGQYRVKVAGPGFSPFTPLAVTRDQEASLKVFSYLDAAVLVFGLAAIALALLLARRPELRRRMLPLARGRRPLEGPLEVEVGGLAEPQLAMAAAAEAAYHAPLAEADFAPYHAPLAEADFAPTVPAPPAVAERSAAKRFSYLDTAVPLGLAAAAVGFVLGRRGRRYPGGVW